MKEFTMNIYNNYETISIKDENSMKINSILTTNEYHEQQYTQLLEEVRKAQENQEHIVIMIHHEVFRQDESEWISFE